MPARLRLEWSRRAEWDDWSRHSEGCYVLRTNLRDWISEALWRTYIQLSEAEATFRIKSELSIRPIWHQREDRVLAHILVCFLAYVLWKTLEQWQSRAGLGNSPPTLLQELAAITSTDVILPAAAPSGRDTAIALRPSDLARAPRSPLDSGPAGTRACGLYMGRAAAGGLQHKRVLSPLRNTDAQEAPEADQSILEEVRIRR